MASPITEQSWRGLWASACCAHGSVKRHEMCTVPQWAPLWKKINPSWATWDSQIPPSHIHSKTETALKAILALQRCSSFCPLTFNPTQSPGKVSPFHHLRRLRAAWLSHLLCSILSSPRGSQARKLNLLSHASLLPCHAFFMKHLVSTLCPQTGVSIPNLFVSRVY